MSAEHTVDMISTLRLSWNSIIEDAVHPGFVLRFDRKKILVVTLES